MPWSIWCPWKAPRSWFPSCWRCSIRTGSATDSVDQRRAERYLDHFDSIWRLQSHLLSEADRQRIPIILSANREQVSREVMNTIISAISVQLIAEPGEVFA